MLVCLSDAALGTLRTKLTTKSGEQLCLAFWGCCNEFGEAESNATLCKHRDRNNMPTDQQVNTVKLEPCHLITAPQAVLLNNQVLRDTYNDVNDATISQWTYRRLNHTWPWIDYHHDNFFDLSWTGRTEFKLMDRSFYKAWYLRDMNDPLEGMEKEWFSGQGFLQNTLGIIFSLNHF